MRLKPKTNPELKKSVPADKQESRLSKEVQRLRRELASTQRCADLVGEHMAEIGRLHQKLDQTQRELQLILDTTSDAMRLVDRDFNIIWVNQSMKRICSKPDREFKNTKCYKTMNFSRCETDQCFLNMVLKCQKRVMAEETIEINHKQRQYLITASPFFDQSGKVIGILEDFIDLTKRYEAQNALRQNEQLIRENEDKYRAVLENSNAYIYMVDQDYRIELINENFIARFCPENKDKDEVIGQLCYQVVANRDQPCPDCKNNLVFRGESPHFEKAMPDGSILEVFNSQVRHPGGKKSKVSISYDITKRKKIEEALLKSRKLESVGVLAGGIAHDFNNFLTIILGNISLLKLSAEPESETYQLLTRAEVASNRAQGLTQQLLTFSSGGAPIKKIISLKKIIKESANFVLHGSNVRCQFRLPKNLGSVEVDEGQIGQVIHNLVLNADQAMPQGGSITIRGKNVSLRKEEIPPLPPGRYIRVDIQDQGEGIAAKHMGNIFDPYFTTRKLGHGLGLAISYSIIENHQGTITVKSDPGKGTTFSFFLPASSDNPPKTKKEKEEIIRGAGRILVMDDDETVRAVAENMLGKLGYEVTTCSDGEKAIKAYLAAQEKNLPFQAVILDLTIPGGMGGKETLKRLKKVDPEVKALVSSGYSTNPVMANYKQAGFSGLISKPYTIQQMSYALKETLENQEPLLPSLPRH